MRDDRYSTDGSGGGTVGLAGISLIADSSSWRDIRSKVEQDRELRRIRLFTTRQVEGDQMALEVCLKVDFRGKSAARAAERLALLPPFAPAAETWARTMVESNICTRCAVELRLAR